MQLFELFLEFSKFLLSGNGRNEDGPENKSEEQAPAKHDHLPVKSPCRLKPARRVNASSRVLLARQERRRCTTVCVVRRGPLSLCRRENRRILGEACRITQFCRPRA